MLRLLGHDRLCPDKTGRQTEETNSEMDKIERRVQIQSDGTEVAQTGETRDGHQGIRSFQKSKQTAAVRPRSYPSPAQSAITPLTG